MLRINIFVNQPHNQTRLDTNKPYVKRLDECLFGSICPSFAAMLLCSHVHPTRSLVTQCNLRIVLQTHLPAARHAYRQPSPAPKSDLATARRRLTTCRVLYSQAPQQDVQAPGIAVLGAGITGLTTAYLLADTFPKLRITLIESKDTLGGWVRSRKVDVGDGEVIFEQGPRSLRPQPPNGTLALRIVCATSIWG